MGLYLCLLKNKLEHFYLTYDIRQAYSYGNTHFISNGCPVWWGNNTIYVGKMLYKIIVRRILKLSSILSGSKIL